MKQRLLAIDKALISSNLYILKKSQAEMRLSNYVQHPSCDFCLHIPESYKCCFLVPDENKNY